MPICSDAAETGLRRAYTRSIPSHLRSVSLLEQSMCDAQQQWEAVVAALVKDSEGHTQARLHAALNRVEKIASQTKSIKQELITYMNCNPTGKIETFEGFVTSAMALPTSSCASSASAESFRVAGLAARVWMWSLCFATVLNDMELLSGSLSFAIAHANYIFASAALPATEANTFFIGEEQSAQSGAAPHDKDVLRACALLYHLYTGDDDAAAEHLAHHLLMNNDEEKEQKEKVEEDADITGNEMDGSISEPADFFTALSRVADWVATEDYAAIGGFMSHNIHALPPLVRFFMQSMQEMVVHRRLVHVGFHKAWRPIIDIETEVIDRKWGEGSVLFADSPRLRACAALHRESLPRRVAWPLPTPLAASCFRIT